uniref:Uncharacterized protein n=1 Tax=Octopus bimaculoides TaxID=37653 RepID=A0A0L8IAW8_OCTBM
MMFMVLGTNCTYENVDNHCYIITVYVMFLSLLLSLTHSLICSLVQNTHTYIYRRTYLQIPFIARGIN